MYSDKCEPTSPALFPVQESYRIPTDLELSGRRPMHKLALQYMTSCLISIQIRTPVRVTENRL